MNSDQPVFGSGTFRHFFWQQFKIELVTRCVELLTLYSRNNTIKNHKFETDRWSECIPTHLNESVFAPGDL